MKLYMIFFAYIVAVNCNKELSALSGKLLEWAQTLDKSDQVRPTREIIGVMHAINTLFLCIISTDEENTKVDY